MELTVTIVLLFSLSAQWFPTIKGSSLTLDRQERDTIHDLKCEWTSRSTGSWAVCTCKSEYATVMSKKDAGWNCYAPTEIGCKYYLGETDKTYVINKTDEAVEFVPSITGNDTSIQNIFIWNYHLDRFLDEGHWDDVTDSVSRFFALDHGGKNKLLISDLDLNKWRGHAIKIAVGGGKCVVAKMSGRINYPINVDEFKRNVTTPVITTTTPSPKTTASGITTTTKTTKPTTKLTTTTQRKNTTIIKTTTPKTKTTASGITTTKPTASTTTKKGKLDSKASTIYIVIGVVLVVVLVATGSIFMFRRRRSSTHQKFDENTENKLRDICVENMQWREASSFVKSDTAKVGFSCSPNGAYNGIERVVDDKSLGADGDMYTKKVAAAQ